MKTTTNILIITALLTPIFLLHAEGIVDAKDIKARTIAPRMEIKDMRKDVKREIKSERMGIKADFKVKIEARKAELKTKVQAIKSEIKDTRAKKLDEKAKVRVGNKLNNIYTRLSERVNQLSRVDSGITKRLSAYTNSGLSIGSVSSLQLSAQALLATAKVDVEATKSASASELNATTTKETLRTLVTTAENSIKSAAESYLKVAKALTAMPKLKINATTTSSVQ